jgi:hypothetical protein
MRKHVKAHRTVSTAGRACGVVRTWGFKKTVTKSFYNGRVIQQKRTSTWLSMNLAWLGLAWVVCACWRCKRFYNVHVIQHRRTVFALCLLLGHRGCRREDPCSTDRSRRCCSGLSLCTAFRQTQNGGAHGHGQPRHVEDPWDHKVRAVEQRSQP